MVGSSLGAGRVLVTEIDGYPGRGDAATITRSCSSPRTCKGSVARIADDPRGARHQHRDAAAHAKRARRRRVHGDRGRRAAGRAGARRDPRRSPWVRWALRLDKVSGLTCTAVTRRRHSRRRSAAASRSRELALEPEAKDQGRPVEEIRAALRRALDVMRGAVAQGMTATPLGVGTGRWRCRQAAHRSAGSARRHALPRHSRARARRAGGERRDGRHRRRADRRRRRRAARGAHRARRRAQASSTSSWSTRSRPPD